MNWSSPLIGQPKRHFSSLYCYLLTSKWACFLLHNWCTCSPNRGRYGGTSELKLLVVTASTTLNRATHNPMFQNQLDFLFVSKSAGQMD